MVDWTVAEGDDIDGVGWREADERLLIDFVGVLGLEDGLVADARPQDGDEDGPPSVDASGVRDAEALRMNVQVVLADPLLIKTCRGANQKVAEPLNHRAGDGLRQLDHQHRSTHSSEPSQPGPSSPPHYSACTHHRS
ncbi:hypothetical protein OHA20_04950 [Streptomyces sp. NBC_01579]